MTADQGLLEAVLDAGGYALRSAQVVQVEPDVGGRTVVGWQVGWTDRAGVQGSDLLYVQPADAEPVEPPGMVVIDPADGQAYRVWRYPDDPDLPALPAAVTPEGVQVLLGRLGAAATVTGLELVSYRPGRRAVLRVATGDDGAYLKLVRPDRVAAIVDRHHRLAAAGLPVPGVRAWSPQGLLVLAALPGVPATGLGASADVLADRITDLSDRLATVEADWPARRTPPRAVDWYAAQVAALAPALAATVRALVEVVRTPEVRTPGVVHGDLHLGQLLVDPHDPRRVTGLLDVDTVGPGHRLDDLSGVLAPLLVDPVPGGEALTAALFDRVPAPQHDDLRRRVGAQLLAYALAPAAEGDLDEAARRLTLAEESVG